MYKKKVPQRSCIGCARVSDKGDLLRIVRNPEGMILLDPNGRLSGRGAYICKNRDCLNMILKKKSLERAFSMKIAGETYEMIGNFVEEYLKSAQETNGTG